MAQQNTKFPSGDSPHLIKVRKDQHEKNMFFVVCLFVSLRSKKVVMLLLLWLDKRYYWYEDEAERENECEKRRKEGA